MNTKKMSLREGILDSLVDDSESIVQIEEYLTYLGISTNRIDVRNMLAELLKDLLIEIIYPPQIKLIDFIKASDEEIEEFWFKLTALGSLEWEKIDY